MRAIWPHIAARFATPLAILVACSCNSPVFPPPAQFVMPSGPDPAVSPDPSAGLLIAMSDPDADAHIQRDVFGSDPGSEWRFTGLHPAFHVDVPRVSPLDFYLRFFNSSEMLAARGPVTFTIAINGKRLQSARISNNGDLEFRRPVPDGWITRPGPVEITIDIDPPWHSPDGTTYGTMLNSIGFEER